jgi:predicted amidohydrolase YtcJ
VTLRDLFVTAARLTMKALTLALIILSLLAVHSPSIQKQPAELIFVNGNIYTVNERQPHAEAVAIKQGRINFVGSNADVKTYEGPTGIPRFAKLGVIASMQPSHAISDLFFAPSRLGTKRLEGAYAWQSLLKSGAIIAGGSDAPVERGEPMIEFYAAVARKSQKGESGEGWHLEQRVSREQALQMFTLWPAVAAFEENRKGSLEIGKLADMTVLSQDIMKISEPEILKTTCVMTVVGEVVFDALESSR